MRTPLKTALQFGFVVLVACFWSCYFGLKPAEARPAPAMTCAMQAYPAEPVCSMSHYFGPHNPQWYVFLDGRLVAKDEGLTFHPVLDERWRTITVRYPNGKGTSSLSVAGRLVNGKTQFREA